MIEWLLQKQIKRIKKKFIDFHLNTTVLCFFFCLLVMDFLEHSTVAKFVCSYVRMYVHLEKDSREKQTMKKTVYLMKVLNSQYKSIPINGESKEMLAFYYFLRG